MGAVRGIAYKLFAAGLITSMAKAQTDKVSRILTDARARGEIPWKWIVDETRNAERARRWSSPDAVIAFAVNGYRRDYWQNQPRWIEVWTEKGTVRGVLAPVLEEYGLTLRVMHGYTSATAVNDVAAESRRADKPLEVLYVGDWDPSGMHMSEEDLPERIGRYRGRITITRIALSAGDVQFGGLPSFEAATKAKDPRQKWFVFRYGGRCWELDAMDPRTLRERVQQQIEERLDLDAWEHAKAIEAAEVESMHRFHRQWRESISRQAREYRGGGEDD